MEGNVQQTVFQQSRHTAGVMLNGRCFALCMGQNVGDGARVFEVLTLHVFTTLDTLLHHQPQLSIPLVVGSGAHSVVLAAVTDHHGCCVFCGCVWILPVVVCLDTWLAAKGLKLDNMQLVQQQLSRQSSSSSSPLTGKQQKGRGSSSLFRRRSAPDQLPSGVIGRYSAGRSSRSGSSCGCPSSFGFVVRQNMEEQLLNTFRQSGFAA